MIDRATFKVIAVAVAGVLVLCVVGIVILTLFDKAVPDILENVTVGSLTGLVGLLASPRGGEPVPVTGEGGGPVEVIASPEGGQVAVGVAVFAAAVLVVAALAIHLL